MKLKTRMKRIKRRLQPRAIKKWLLEDRYHQGLGGPPNMHRHSPHYKSIQHGIDVGVDYYSISFNNDASEVWIWQQWEEEGGKWRFSCQTREFRKMALWYLWRWAWGEWFGLRRQLFYRDLRRWSKDQRERASGSD